MWVTAALERRWPARSWGFRRCSPLLPVGRPSTGHVAGTRSVDFMTSPVSARSLIEVLTRLDEIPEEATLYAAEPWSAASPVCVSDDDCAPAGFTYLLEVELAQDVIEVWSLWRGGAQPTDLQKCEAVLHYATHDAYLPADVA
jgi:hypothetical protein